MFFITMSLGVWFLFILQIIVAICLIVIVLLQSSDEDALSGIGGGNSQMKFLTHKSSVNLITKITIVLGVILMANSFTLANIFTRQYNKEKKGFIKDYLDKNQKVQNNSKDLKKDTKEKNVSQLNETKTIEQNIKTNKNIEKQNNKNITQNPLKNNK